MSIDAASMKWLGAQSQVVQAAAPALAVASPCRSVCQMDALNGHCRGCLRTLDEIRLWGNAENTFKRFVWADLPRRIKACAA